MKWRPMRSPESTSPFRAASTWPCRDLRAAASRRCFPSWPRGVVLVQDVDGGGKRLDGRGAAKIDETKQRAAAGPDGEVAASHAEIIALQGIHMEGGAALAQD